MAVDFSEFSNYEPETGFSLLRFGANAPLLEVELNEFQQIMLDNFQSLAEHFMGEDGLLGVENNMSYDNGTFEIEDVVAVIEGKFIVITELEIDASEGDEIYLEVWEQVIDYEDEIKLWGNQQEESTVTNYLVDERVGSETSRRIQIQYDLTTDPVNPAHDYLLLAEIDGGEVDSKVDTAISIPTFEDYIDDRITEVEDALDTYEDRKVERSGDSMTGDLEIEDENAVKFGDRFKVSHNDSDDSLEIEVID